ncbi:MAG: hypothetical protein LBT36_00280 [Oscillospiraceae bacterium]|jgi:hypothetical protein|nr:hypothetical protein [Oscillospiraceae bacterium]
MSTGLIVAISVVIVAAWLYLNLRRNKKLLEAGRIIKRDSHFIESSETFTLSGGEFAKLVPALQTMDITGTGVSWESKGATQTVSFKSGNGWTAVLTALERGGEKYRYRFQFTGWKTRNGAPLSEDTMNMLLTSLEKAFLTLDPNTQVETERFKTKSKTKFL